MTVGRMEDNFNSTVARPTGRVVVNATTRPGCRHEPIGLGRGEPMKAEASEHQWFDLSWAIAHCSLAAAFYAGQ